MLQQEVCSRALEELEASRSSGDLRAFCIHIYKRVQKPENWLKQKE
jgi:hypothetical protein